MLVLSSLTGTALGLVQDVNFPKSGNILCSSLFRKCSEHNYVPWSSTRPKADNQENYELPCLIRLAYHFSSDAEPLSERHLSCILPPSSKQKGTVSIRAAMDVSIVFLLH